MRIIKNLTSLLYVSFALSTAVLTTGCERVTYLFTYPISPSRLIERQEENIHKNEMRL